MGIGMNGSIPSPLAPLVTSANYDNDWGRAWDAKYVLKSVKVQRNTTGIMSDSQP